MTWPYSETVFEGVYITLRLGITHREVFFGPREVYYYIAPATRRQDKNAPLVLFVVFVVSRKIMAFGITVFCGIYFANQSPKIMPRLFSRQIRPLVVLSGVHDSS